MPADLYGQALLRYVMETDVTATLTLEQLELADYAGARVAGLPYDAPTADRVRACIDRARMLISGAIRRGRAQDAPDAPALPAGVAPSKPNLGPMAPLLDAPIIRPPSGGYADAPGARKYDNVQF